MNTEQPIAEWRALPENVTAFNPKRPRGYLAIIQAPDGAWCGVGVFQTYEDAERRAMAMLLAYAPTLTGTEWYAIVRREVEPRLAGSGRMVKNLATGEMVEVES